MIDFSHLGSLRRRMVRAKAQSKRVKELRSIAKSKLQKATLDRAIDSHERRVVSLQKRIDDEHKLLGFKPVSLEDVMGGYDLVLPQE